MSYRDIGRPYEVLWVEDNPGDVRLAKEAMKETEAEVNLSIVENGVNALNFLRHDGPYSDAPAPDIVVLDLTLPKKDGLEVLAEIKADDALKCTPVIVLTSSSASQDIFRAYESYANCYITKPTDIDDYFKVVKAIEGFWFNVVELPANA